MSARLLRGGRPAGARPFLLPALIVLAAAAVSVAPGPWRLEAQALGAGQVWRLFTGHLVHATWPHFLLDVGAAALLLSFLRARWSLFVLPPVVGLGVLLWRPELSHYVGLSGVLHGLTVQVAVELARSERGAARALALLLGAGVLGKAVLETALGVSLFTQDLDMGGVTVHEAHLLGALAGLAVSSLARRPVLAHGLGHGRTGDHRRGRRRGPRDGLRAARARDPLLARGGVLAPRGQHP